MDAPPRRPDESGRPADGNRQLRGQLRDLVAVLALPAMWRGLEPEAIAGNLLDVVCSLLRLDFAYVHIAAEGSPTIEAWRPRDAGAASDGAAVLAPWRALDAADVAVSGSEPLQAGAQRLIRMPVAPLGGAGHVLAGSRRSDFPSEQERFLLRVALDQAMIAIDGARLLRRERAARAEAETAVRARDEFLAIASHELRNPIATIKGAAQLLLRSRARGRLDDERLDHYLAIIGQTSARLAVLMEDLLDVSRLQGGRLPLRRRPTDLAELVGDAVARQQMQTTSHRLALVIEAVGSPEVDPDRIEQVVTNLLDNAIKYAPGGGEIQTELRRDDGGIVLSVRDPGIGLPPGAAEQIFRPFGRAANAAAQYLPGLGLGLYISRQIVEQHGGRLWAESPGEGSGTTVTMWLPDTHPLDERGPAGA